MGIRVDEPGMLTTVQDLGRSGFRQYGIPVSGALDSRAAAIANMMLANPRDAALLEMTLLGPTLLFTESHWVCLTGADMQATLFLGEFSAKRSSGEVLKLGRVYPVSAGDRLTIGRSVNGLQRLFCCAWRAEGGFGFRQRQYVFAGQGGWFSWAAPTGW